MEEIFVAIPSHYPGIHLGRLRDILRPRLASDFAEFTY
jgi:hypothetical protein